ncbi:MAG TPA: NAD(P)/FAD-dependent oxidoreductase [Gemmatimonadaceae bacterium]|nr:NAD(P)/FAD-dependent oxidoreductase [Gemmatimonadaceae bacterium]
MTYDAIIVGGGLAGCTLADQLVCAGHHVLVLERETQFRDRVRGENMLPWGSAAARRLGVYDTLIAAGAHVAPTWATYTFGSLDPTRDLPSTTPGGDAMLNIFHPHMQEALLGRAVASGAIVLRGATVLGVDAGPGKSPSVTFEHHGAPTTVTARIVVGADGRASQMRAWGGFDVQRNPELLTIAGMLVGGTNVPEHSAILAIGPGIVSFWAPLGNKKSRTYFVYPSVAGKRGLSGKAKVDDFFQAVRSVGLPSSWLDGAESLGPLAEFDGADKWVESPAKNGVVLIGDAAASSDPSWGSGLSLSLLDVECLANSLRAEADWNVAIAQYAKEHDVYYGALHRILQWMTELVWTPGPAGDERRMRVFPRMKTDPTGFPDSVGLGPFGPSDERARRLVLGLD